MSNKLFEDQITNSSNPEETGQVLEAVGYHNYFMIGLPRALELIQDQCPEGWDATYQPVGTSLPNGALRVGQVLIRTGDQAYPLYVYPQPKS